jgi:hypothetical protein
MNVLEANRDAYLARANSKRRVAVIVVGVIVFHVVVIGLAARWHGWNPKVGEGLIRVNIVGGAR